MNTTGTVLASQVTNDARGMYYAATEKDGSIVAISAVTADLLSRFDIPVLRIIEDPKPPTVKERYAAAVKAVRKSGVTIRQNVSACCRGCAEPFKNSKGFDAETTPYAWNFGGQGGAVRWSGNGQYTYLPSDGYYYGRQGNPDTQKVYFNHGNGSAARIVAAFEAEGFEVIWDGEQSSCIEVIVPARVKSRYER